VRWSRRCQARRPRRPGGTPSDAPLSSAAFGRNPWLQPLRGWNDGVDRLAEGLRVRGRLPIELRGTLFRNGPGLLERGAQRYAHWFDGDGLVQAWRFEGEGARQPSGALRADAQVPTRAGRGRVPRAGLRYPHRSARAAARPPTT
jgi:all-trans-8'-apo-beta-carotenal 15,15'-oxygenase